MTRSKGSRNKDFDEARLALIRKVQAHLLDKPDPTISFRALAEVVGVGVPTLAHYFGDRDGLWLAVMQAFRADGEVHIQNAFKHRPKDLKASLEAFVAQLLVGWRMGLCALHQFGLRSGFSHPELGPAYVNELLEPTVEALEKRFALHEAEGSFPPGDHRHAALCFLSPLLIALTHQDALLGKECRPLDLQAFAADHIARFVKAWG